MDYKSVQDVNRQGVRDLRQSGEVKTMMLKEQLWRNKLWYCPGDV